MFCSPFVKRLHSTARPHSRLQTCVVICRQNRLVIQFKAKIITPPTPHCLLRLGPPHFSSTEPKGKFILDSVLWVRPLRERHTARNPEWNKVPSGRQSRRRVALQRCWPRTSQHASSQFAHHFTNIKCLYHNTAVKSLTTWQLYSEGVNIHNTDRISHIRSGFLVIWL